MQKFQNKTRILVTHAIEFLPHVDTVILMKDGEVIAKGSYNEVKTNPVMEKIIQANEKTRNQSSEAKVEE